MNYTTNTQEIPEQKKKILLWYYKMCLIESTVTSLWLMYKKKKNCIGQHESNVEQSTKAGKKITGNKHKKKIWHINIPYIRIIMTYLSVICYRSAVMLFQSSKWLTVPEVDNRPTGRSCVCRCWEKQRVIQRSRLHYELWL